MAEKQGLGGLFGAASGDGHYCPEGIPVELGLLSILAAFGVAFGVLYIALTIATGRRKKRSLDSEVVETWGACEATDMQEFVGCKVEHLVGPNNSFYKWADLLWHGEFWQGVYLKINLKLNSNRAQPNVWLSSKALNRIFD